MRRGEIRCLMTYADVPSVEALVEVEAELVGEVDLAAVVVDSVPSEESADARSDGAVG